MTGTFVATEEALKDAKNGWGDVKGPFAAAITSAQRIKWKFTSASEVLMDNGETLEPCYGLASIRVPDGH